MYVTQLLWKTVWQYLSKLRTCIHYNPTILFLGVNVYIFYQKACTRMFIAALFITTLNDNYLKVHQQMMDKEDVVHIYNGILLSHKNE